MTLHRTALILVAVLLSLTPRALAQGEQWLSYRSGDDVAARCGGAEGQTIELSGEAPPGVRAPAFQAAPLWGAWKTPLVSAGHLRLALDRSAADKPYDRLFIDTDADGELADETPVAAVAASAAAQVQAAKFRQVRLVLETADGPVTYHLNLDLWLSPQRRQFVAQAGGWYEGRVRVGEKTLACALYDADANGRFNDAREDFRLSDRLSLEGTGFAMGRVGRCVIADGTLMALEVAPDGAWIRLSPAADVPMGVLRVGERIERISVGGAAGLLALAVADGRVALPAGRYRLNHWEAVRQDDRGYPWRAVAVVPAAGDGIDVTIEAGRTVDLDIGEPLKAAVTVVPRSVGPAGGLKSFTFADPRLTGRRGERIAITCEGRQAPPPKLEIAAADGSYRELYDFQFG
ncbi:MAG: hypothetical protein GX591_12100 [Planctomycetes bacterium]|nr:hypothetical protein [Planctomycetota bacterium]